jgi:phosphoribosylformimino-5-aminoimidazole carboxamide ribotide isomerase
MKPSATLAPHASAGVSDQPSAISHPPSAKFTLFPAIDLRAGQVVRLAQGDPARQTLYANDPRAVAERWQAEGADWLHVVNLDGAFGNNTITNNQSLSAILSTAINVQFGGGLRDPASLRRAFDAGISRAVIGTAAIENPALVEWALREYGPERIAVGVDARAGRVRIKGWAEESALTAIELGQRLRAQGVEWCIFTDIARDGVGAGVNVTATAELARATGLRVIASGGVADVDDVRRVREAGLAGIIIGRALYEGKVNLKEIIHE